MSTPPYALPLQQSERLQIIDSLRGIALCGILLMNIPYFGMPWMWDFDLRLRNEFSGPNYYTWWIVRLFFEGTMRGFFSMLFGAGCILLLERLEKRPPGDISPADIYYRRLLWLLVFGFIDANLFLWNGDVLLVYALGGLVLYPFRHAKPRLLLIVAIAALAIGTFKGTTQLYEQKNKRVKGEAALALEKQKVTLTEKQKKEKEAWEEYKKEHTPAELSKKAKEEIKAFRGGFTSVLKHIFPRNAEFQKMSVYGFFFWDLMVCFFLGMYLYRTGVLTGAKPPSFYWKLMLAGYAIGLPLNYWQLSSALRLNFDNTHLADTMYISWYEIRRVLLLMGHLGLLMLLYKYGAAKWFFRIMAAVGQMAFTNYLMQSIICGFIFYGVGLRWYGALERYQLYVITAGVWVFQVIASNIWLKYFRFGPFEWVWRSLTYWRKQPFKRNTPVIER
ncbi:DUF418 domain-containing protein [Chitinophaga sp. GCM10012297]|uniref:DUF418 domain-containing protein n=1 Tax=Chitinophaga chungangae TaxID=2821488 RepID=A0ABS3YI84_9BACT|nr:DUF418 domain-containing protein [Chitinophaga chungangae]MBO9154400.1 DUF418 domain-containing protein [Chitinophaga chungangae]